MKPFAAVLAFLFAPIAFANMITVNDFPADLVCEAPTARMPDVRTVEVTKLNTEDPESTVRMGLQETSWLGLEYSVSFSDECEGWYAFTFKIDDLTQMKLGRRETIEATFEYDDLAEFFPDVPPDTQETQHDLVKATCRLK
jgi:hypothetical protein